MSKKKRKPPKSVPYRDLVASVDDLGVAGSAKKHGVSVATVYAAMRKFRDGAKQPVKKAAASVPALSVSIQLPAVSGGAEIKLRNGGGELLGTLVLEQDGMIYRRPNQKSAPDRKLSWTVLDKLMQSGLV